MHTNCQLTCSFFQQGSRYDHLWYHVVGNIQRWGNSRHGIFVPWIEHIFVCQIVSTAGGPWLQLSYLNGWGEAERRQYSRMISICVRSIRVCMWFCLCVPIPVCSVCAHVRACVRACMRACACVCVCVCAVCMCLLMWRGQVIIKRPPCWPLLSST